MTHTTQYIIDHEMDEIALAMIPVNSQYAAFHLF